MIKILYKGFERVEISIWEELNYVAKCLYMPDAGAGSTRADEDTTLVNMLSI